MSELGYWDRFKVKGAEKRAARDFDFRILSTILSKRPALDNALAHRAVELLEEGSVELCLLYCLAFADHHPEAAAYLLQRLLDGNVKDIWRDLEQEEVIKLATLAARADMASYDRLLACCSRRQLEEVRLDDPSTPAYAHWLNRWLVISAAGFETDADSTAISRLLKEHPEGEQILAERAESLLARSPWLSLIYCLAFARNDSPRALPLLRSLLGLPEEKTISWDYIELEDIRGLAGFVFTALS